MGARYLGYAIPGVIIGLVLHGIWWLLGNLPFIPYGAPFSGPGLVVWVVSLYLAGVLIQLAEEGWRKTIIMWVQWTIIVGAIYALVGTLIWYFSSYPDAPLVSWFRDTVKSLATYWDNDLASGWKVAILVFAFIAFFTLVPWTCYIVWSGVKGIFTRVSVPRLGRGRRGSGGSSPGVR